MRQSRSTYVLVHNISRICVKPVVCGINMYKHSIVLSTGSVVERGPSGKIATVQIYSSHVHGGRGAYVLRAGRRKSRHPLAYDLPVVVLVWLRRLIDCFALLFNIHRESRDLLVHPLLVWVFSHPRLGQERLNPAGVFVGTFTDSWLALLQTDTTVDYSFQELCCAASNSL
jgi:hypothetical protein